jgi:hypothetical protein
MVNADVHVRIDEAGEREKTAPVDHARRATRIDARGELGELAAPDADIEHLDVGDARANDPQIANDQIEHQVPPGWGITLALTGTPPACVPGTVRKSRKEKAFIGTRHEVALRGRDGGAASCSTCNLMLDLLNIGTLQHTYVNTFSQPGARYATCREKHVNRAPARGGRWTPLTVGWRW